MPQEKELLQTVGTEGDGLRVDRWLSTWIDISSRSRAAQLISEGRVRINGKITKPSQILKTGDLVVVNFPLSVESKIEAYDIPLKILFEDRDVLVVNKPSGLVVHPAAGHQVDTLVNALMAHTKDLSMGFGEERPGIVHRLDKDTSGLLVVAKNDLAQASLVEQFKARRIHRLYQALCHGKIVKPQGRFESWLARHPTDRKRFASVQDTSGKVIRAPEPAPSQGKWAATNYRRISVKHEMTFVELRLETGRTHQIRVHLSEAGHPLIGDHLYGAQRKMNSISNSLIQQEVRGLSRFFLHARELGFIHPRSKEQMMFAAEWPSEDFEKLQRWGFL